ncbi:hypothetical protein [Reinekea sp.]|uniref:hypothetical protein n=1 Tax=Reinekea sp. TaxID=1970455 RepID=UPI00398A12B4
MGSKYIIPSEELDCFLSELLRAYLQVKSEFKIPYMDDGQVHLITTADLDGLNEKYVAALTSTRFRPNLVIASEFLSLDILKSDTI